MVTPVGCTAKQIGRSVALSLEQIIDVAASLNSAVLSDSLDALGRPGQVLPGRIRPLDPGMRIVGLAATIEISETLAVPPEPYRGITDTIDIARAGSVIVIVSATERCAVWGELFSTAAQARGVRGTLIDGYTRDVERIIAQGFPVFARGSLPVDMKGRGQFLTAGETVEIGGVRINPHDLVFGDRDGVVIVPSDILGDVVRRAAEKLGIEDLVRAELRRGVQMQRVWEEHGVL
jgi:regulator of RNase E activity RraA